MNRNQSRRVWILCLLAAIALLVALLTGCGTARAHMYYGQGADLATTWYAIEDGAEESNPLADDVEDVAWMKAGVCCIVELAAHIWPEYRDNIYKVGAWAGYLAGAQNVVQIVGEEL